MSQAIYLANNTHKPIQCIVLPDPNALLVDIFKPEASRACRPEKRLKPSVI